MRRAIQLTIIWVMVWVIKIKRFLFPRPFRVVAIRRRCIICRRRLRRSIASPTPGLCQRCYRRRAARFAVSYTDEVRRMVDAVDKLGRRYLEVPAFPDGVLKRAFAAAEPDRCVDCSAPVRHAFERYFQRNEPMDGAGGGLAAALLGMTYDCVCAACGDRQLREDAH